MSYRLLELSDKLSELLDRLSELSDKLSEAPERLLEASEASNRFSKIHRSTVPPGLLPHQHQT